MKKYIYSNRKEIEMKNANQNNINSVNSFNKKEAKLTKIKECINTPLENKQDSFFIKKKSNISNYAFVEIIHKKTRTNKNLIEAKSKRKNDIIKESLLPKNLSRNNNNENENINSNNKNDNISFNNSLYIKNEFKNNTKLKLNNKIVSSKKDIRIEEEKKEKKEKEKRKRRKKSPK